MVVKETITINGKLFVRNYSDAGYLIERDGARYGEAIDPIDVDRTYVETDELIEGSEEEIDGDEFLELVKAVM